MPVARHRPTPTRPRILIGRPPVPASVTCPLGVVPATMPIFGQVTGGAQVGGGIFTVDPYLPPGGLLILSPLDTPPADFSDLGAADPVYSEDGPA